MASSTCSYLLLSKNKLPFLFSFCLSRRVVQVINMFVLIYRHMTWHIVNLKQTTKTVYPTLLIFQTSEFSIWFESYLLMNHFITDKWKNKYLSRYLKHAYMIHFFFFRGKRMSSIILYIYIRIFTQYFKQNGID
jgi:hypothetical protein